MKSKSLFVVWVALWFTIGLAVSPYARGAEPPVKAAPFTPGIDTVDDAKDATVFGNDRDKKRGDKGLKQIDPPKFDLPSPFVMAGGLVVIAVKVAIFLVQLTVIVVVVWIIVRAAQRKRETGTVSLAKGEKTLFDIFDDAVAELKTRRSDRAKELSEIDKRISDKPVKAKAKHG